MLVCLWRWLVRRELGAAIVVVAFFSQYLPWIVNPKGLEFSIILLRRSRPWGRHRHSHIQWRRTLALDQRAGLSRLRGGDLRVLPAGARGRIGDRRKPSRRGFRSHPGDEPSGRSLPRTSFSYVPTAREGSPATRGRAEGALATKGRTEGRGGTAACGEEGEGEGAEGVKWRACAPYITGACPLRSADWPVGAVVTSGPAPRSRGSRAPAKAQRRSRAPTRAATSAAQGCRRARWSTARRTS